MSYLRMMLLLSSLAVGIIGMPGCAAKSIDVPIAAGKVQADSSQSVFLDGFFPIGVFGQPAESFGKWKSRGVNTVLEVPQRHDPEAWDKAAQAAGLKVIRRPAADPRRDIGRKDLLAWSHWDEPDAAGRIIEWTPLFEKTYAEWKKVDPDRKVFINFAGPDLSWFTTRSDAYSKSYSSYYPRLIASADWIANDLYPSGGWLNDAHKGRRGDVTLITEPLKILKRMTPKPLFAFIELSEIEAGNVEGARCPTAPEVRAQIWLAIIHGARGLFYFPAVVGKRGFQFDGAPAEIVDEMKRQNAAVEKLAAVLQGPIDPPEFTPRAAGPLQLGWRRSKSGWLLIAVNSSTSSIPQASITVGVGKSATLPVEGREVKIGSGRITDDFAPHAVHIYEIPLASD